MSDASGQVEAVSESTLSRQLAQACRALPSLPLDAGERERLRRLGTLGHRRMLALPEPQRYEAIGLALDGARLYGWLQATSPDEPDWVAVMEEQFCRYGALWIKDQGRADPHLALRALPLIDRLLHFHPETQDWIAATRQQLEQAAAPIPLGSFAPPSGPAPFPWPEPLHTYRLGHRLARNAVVLPIGVIADGEWFSDCLQYLPAGWHEAPWMQRLAGYQLERVGDSVSLRPLPDPEPSPLRLEGTWCVLNDIVGHRNLGHFFHDTLPQLAALRRLTAELGPLKLLACRERYANLAHLRRLLWPGEVQFRDELPASFSVERLVLQPVACNGGSGFHPHFQRSWSFALEDYREGVELLRRGLHQPSPAFALKDLWIYFSRNLAAPTEVPHGRDFSNHAALLEQLSNLGVLILDPGHHDIRALHGLIRQARGFIGIHGAGLANALLAPEGTPVIEIRPHGGAWMMLELAGRAAGLDWQVISCCADPAVPGRSVLPIRDLLERIQ